MLHPSYTDLIKIVNDEAEGDTPVVNSRYTIVMATAKRARDIIAEGDSASEYGPDHQKLKPLSQAVKELSEGSLRIIPEGCEEDEPEQVPAPEEIVSEAEEAEEAEAAEDAADEDIPADEAPASSEETL